MHRLPDSGAANGRAATLLPWTDRADQTLAAATTGDVALVRKRHPVFRVATLLASPIKRLNHVLAYPAGHWLAATVVTASDTERQQVHVWKSDVPAPLPVVSDIAAFRRETTPAEIDLAEESPP